MSRGYGADTAQRLGLSQAGQPAVRIVIWSWRQEAQLARAFVSLLGVCLYSPSPVSRGQLDWSIKLSQGSWPVTSLPYVRPVSAAKLAFRVSALGTRLGGSVGFRLREKEREIWTRPSQLLA